MFSCKLFNKALIITSISLLLSACGGGDTDSSSNSNHVTPAPLNLAPTANAGQDQNVVMSAYSGLIIELSGIASDSDGTIQTIKWEDKTTISGQEGIEILDSDKLTASFKLNNLNINKEQAYTLSLTITDDDGATANDEILVTVKPNKPIDIALPDNINGARLVQLSDEQILITGGCKKLLAELRESSTAIYGCLEPSYKSFILNLNDNSLSQVGDANFARPLPNRYQSTTLLGDGRVMLYSQDNGLTIRYTGTEWEQNYDEYAKHYGEIFDPNTQEFTPIPSMNEMRTFPMPARLSDDSILFFAGTDIRKAAFLLNHTKTIEMYQPENNSWKTVSATYPELYDEIITATLPDDKVLLVGGRDTFNGGTNKAYIYDHAQQLVTEIETYIPSGSDACVNDNSSGNYCINLDVLVNNNGGPSVQRVNLEDGSFCLVPGGSSWLIRFNPDTQTFNYDTQPCEHLKSVTGRVELAGAAHVEIKPGITWLSQQSLDLKNIPAQHNAEGNYYEFTQPMIIRIAR